jgi:NhaP-type Na+/H+ or K+/H+ antiporter
MMFVALGLVLGGLGFKIFAFDFSGEAYTVVAELTLVLVLFADAARIDLRSLIREQDLPIRMLTIGMTLTVAAGTGAALLLFTGLSLWEAAVLAVILAPTDAALAQAVISSRALPVRLRQTLNVESGLNDGIALPLLVLFLVLSGHFTGQQERSLVLFAVLQLGLGPVAGVIVGYAGGKLLLASHRRGWIDHSFLSLSALALAILAYAGAEAIGGNGFIAAFVAGLTMGNAAREVCMTLYDFAEAEGQLLILFTFLVFGASMVPAAVGAVNWVVVVYALLSLTLVRMLPVAVSLLGGKLMWQTTVLLGWFGPRGVASIIYTLIILRKASLPGSETVLTVALTTIFLSIFLHGLTAVPLSGWYRRMIERMAEEEEMEAMPEMKPVSDLRTRVRM